MTKVLKPKERKELIAEYEASRQESEMVQLQREIAELRSTIQHLISVMTGSPVMVEPSNQISLALEEKTK